MPDAPDPSAPPPLDERSGTELAARAVTASPLSIVITAAERDDPVVWVNEGFCQLTGYTREEVLGRSWRLLLGPNTDVGAVRLLVNDLRTGQTAAGTLLTYQRNGTPFWNQIVITPIRDTDGQVTHHVSIGTDATVQVMTERAREAERELDKSTADRLELLAQVSDAVAEHLDYYQAADALADLAVPSLADWGFVGLLDERGALEHLRIATDPTKTAMARALEGLDHTWMWSSDTIREAAGAGPDDVLMPRMMHAHELVRLVSPDYHALITRLGMGSWLLVPLFARDRTIGLLGLVRTDPDGFDVRTVVTATRLGRRVGLALDNARLYLGERQAALTLQHRLLPQVTDVPGFEVSATYRPSGQRAEVGGDWYDVLPGALTAERGAVFTVGDIVGHDIAAAAAMGQVSSLLRARQWGGESPAQVLGTLASLLESLGWDDVATIVCLRCRRDDPDRMGVEYVNAGHPPPFVRLPDGTVSSLPLARTLPVGLLPPGTVVHGEELTLPVGSTVVLYTDGLVERRDRSLADGLTALEQALHDAPDGTAEQVRDHLLSVLVDDQPEDDLCLLVVRCLPD